MKNKFKVLLISVLTLALAASFALFAAACNKGGDSTTDGGNVTYTVTLTCEDGDSLFGYLTVKLENADGVTVAESALSDSKATMTAPKGTYSVKIDASNPIINEMYTFSQATVTPENPSVTVQMYLKGEEPAETVTYKVTVLYRNGDPAANLPIQLCTAGGEGACHPATTDSAGVAEVQLPADEYEIHIEKSLIPEGYTFDDTQYTIGPDAGELTVYLESL